MIVLQSSSGTLLLRRCGNRNAACPYRKRPDDTSLQQPWFRCLGVDHPSTASDWLLKAMTRGDDMMLLRQIVADGSRPVAWQSNHQVLQQVARKVAQRELCALLEEHPVTNAEIGARATAVAASAGVTPSMLRGSSAVEPAPVVVQELEWMDDIDQPVQVAALEAAARDGVPFCEMCARAAQARAASASPAS